MKRQSFFKTLTIGVLTVMTAAPYVVAKTDFNEVGKQMVIMLRNSHYERYQFDENLGARFFDAYIDSLDGNKQYFLAADVDAFRLKYGKNLHQMLLDE